MKGYVVQSGYMGWIATEKCYRLFSCEADYIEFLEEENA